MQGLHRAQPRAAHYRHSYWFNSIIQIDIAVYNNLIMFQVCLCALVAVAVVFFPASFRWSLCAHRNGFAIIFKRAN